MTDAPNTFVIGGTANSGAAIVEQVASAGGEVGFTYNSEDTRAESLASASDAVTAWKCDVTDGDAVRSIVDRAFTELGTIDAIVYTVGIIARASIDKTDWETWQHHLDVNLTGAFNALKAAIPHLEEQGSGAIVAVSASDAIKQNENLSAYNASKSGLDALVQAAARELASYGVRVNAVAPGPIRDPDALSESAREELVQTTPLDRICTPDDVADLVLYLCSGNAAHITGAIVPIDGGINV